MMFVFITVTLNPAIDTLIEVKNLKEDGISKIISKHQVAGGKGINISKVLATLGEKTFATGFLGGITGKAVAKELSRMHIDHQFITIDGETRENIKIFDNKDHKTYELNEIGPSCDLQNFNKLIMLLKSIVKPKDVVIISGSAPFDFDADIYKVMINQIKGLVSMIILDTSKDWFKEGITAIPDLIKPNLEELKQYSKKDLSDETMMIEEALKICRLGVKEVLLSLGDKGSLYVSLDAVYRIHIPKIEVKKTVGAGDALLAGFISSKPKYGIIEALSRAAAISLAHVSEQQDIKELQKLIKIEKMKA